jgi:hypothetical protein
MGADEGAGAAALAGKFAELRPHLDERRWRLYLGSEARARAAGSGCSLAAAAAVVAAAAGVSRATVAAGAGELADGAEPMAGRARRPGAGRPRLEDGTPGLKQALLGLVEPSTRGDPVVAVTWTTLSLRDLRRQLAAAGFRCGKDAAARMLHEAGYSLQGMSRVLEGRQHPDRDAQFRHVNDMIAEFAAAGDPAVSVDAKKKEQLGRYHRAGRSWRPEGDPVKVRDHDFPDPAAGKVTPFGVYDIAANRGFVTVGTSHDTAAFAVAALRSWWRAEGSLRYPGSRRLLVTCDAGGSNAVRSRLWKHELALLAAETGLEIAVCHFPPGTSKWNKIEHRLFCHITRTWRGRPLMTAADAVAGIAATVTYQGLKVTAVLDDGDYPQGEKVSDARMRFLEERVLDRRGPRGEWNYAVPPAPRPAPGPAPAPAPAGRCPAGQLNHPALTGMDPAGVEALAAALRVPFGARRERDLFAHRGGPRVNAEGSGTPRRITVLDHVLALRLRDHLGLPVQAIAALLGADHSTASRAAALARQLIAEAAIPLPPAAPPPDQPPRTPAELHQYAAAAGIALAIPRNGPQMPQRFRTRRPNATHPRQPT